MCLGVSLFVMTDMPDPHSALESCTTPTTTGCLASEDFYLDGDFVVFTSVYHCKRGFCCKSDCRHCLYK